MKKSKFYMCLLENMNFLEKIVLKNKDLWKWDIYGFLCIKQKFWIELKFNEFVLWLIKIF